MSRLRPERACHPLAPFFRRRLAHLLKRLTPEERAIIRLLPVLLGGRFRRPGYDREPPGVQRMPRRRRWGRACEAIDFPPPLGFATTRPLVRSALLIAHGDRWELVLVTVTERSPEEHRRLDERVQMLQMLLARWAPRLSIVVEPKVSAERLFFAGLVAGDVPFLEAQDTIEPTRISKFAPTPLARALALTATTEEPFSRLLPGLSLACPDLFAAAASCDDRLLNLVRQLGPEPGIVELGLASRVVRHAAHLQWKRLSGKPRRQLGQELKRWIMGGHVLPALRPAFEALLEKHAPIEVKDGNTWRLELDGQSLFQAHSLDSLRARSLNESPKLCPNQAEWRRARTLLLSKSPRTLFVIEPGFLKHLALSLGPTGRLRARRLTTADCIRLALGMKAAGRLLEVAPRPGADPLLVSRLSQIASADVPRGVAIGVQRGDRLLLAAEGRVRNLPLAKALGRPRRLALLPEHADWGPAMRPPRGVASRLAVHVTLYAAAPELVQALFVDGTGRILLETFPRNQIDTWVDDTRALLDQVGASLSLGVSPSLASTMGRLSSESVDPIELQVEIDELGHAIVALETDRFGAGQAMGWRALAETVFSHWPPRVRGRVKISRVTWARQTNDASALEVLSVRARVLRRLTAHLGSLARYLEAA